MRIAIVSTPRSGNTWIRTVLSSLYDLRQISVHNPVDLPAEPADNCIVQLHWYREPNFQHWLRRHGFHVVVIARDPRDVLLSMLHFARREPETSRWLEGNAELPPDFGAAQPTDPTFARYALSWGAENVLGVSYAWWHEPDAIRLRYEELVRDPARALAPLLARLGNGNPLGDALHQARLEVWQATWNNHGWQGMPGLWRSLIPPGLARRIYRRHARVFRTLGYERGFSLLTRGAARRHWARLAVSRKDAKVGPAV